MIIANTIMMATYSYEETPKQYMWRQYLDETFVDIYVIEIVLKLIGYGPRTFVQDRFNIFDAFIVAIGLIDHILIQWIGLDFERVTALQFFKALRAIRILKLARFNKGIRKVLAQTVKSLGAIAGFSSLLLLFIYIWALMGMELFAYRAVLDQEGNFIKP